MKPQAKPDRPQVKGATFFNLATEDNVYVFCVDPVDGEFWFAGVLSADDMTRLDDAFEAILQADQMLDIFEQKVDSWLSMDPHQSQERMRAWLAAKRGHNRQVKGLPEGGEQ